MGTNMNKSTSQPEQRVYIYTLGNNNKKTKKKNNWMEVGTGREGIGKLGKLSHGLGILRFNWKLTFQTIEEVGRGRFNPITNANELLLAN